MSIAENIENVKYKIANAAKKFGKAGDDIKLIGVSKTIDVSTILQAVNAGITDLGENKPQEIRDKFPVIDNVNWHMIGHLQTNKIKYIIDKVTLIHSIDSTNLLEQVNIYAKSIKKVQDVLIQINISEEETKSGINKNELSNMLEFASNLDNIRVRGLMTIASAFNNIDQNKKLFEICNNLFVDNQAKTYHNIHMDYLSMGMSGDYEAAIEMGSNLVRIGTGIFGVRNYNK